MNDSNNVFNNNNVTPIPQPTDSNGVNTIPEMNNPTIKKCHISRKC